MTWRSHTTAASWITSKYPGIGVRASLVPPSGDNGPGYLFNDIQDLSDEMRGLILTRPAQGTLITNEDSSFSFTDAPPGVYYATYRGIRNGVVYGEFSIELRIGTVQQRAITLLSLKNNTGTPLANQAGYTVDVYELDTGELLFRQTDITTTAQASIVIEHASLVENREYRCVIHNGAAQGLSRVVAS